MIDGYHVMTSDGLDVVDSKTLNDAITDIVSSLTVKMDYISHVQPCACFQCERIYGKKKGE